KAKRSHRTNSRTAGRNTKKKAPLHRTSRTAASGRSARPLISTVIFDLDDTLYDCFRQRVQLAHRHAAQAMVKAGVKGTTEQVFKVRMAAFKRDPHLHTIDAAVFRHFRVTNPELVGMRARAAYFSTPVGKLALFPASRHVL